MVHLAAILALALPSEALADDACVQTFTEFDVRTLVNQSDEAVFRDDMLTHRRLYAEFATRVACLGGQLPKEPWAELLLSETLARFAVKGDWQRPLTTALQVLPELEVPKHVLQAWSPPPPPRVADVKIPDDATIFIDGVLVPRIPELRGEHVAQLWRDDQWTSVWLVDATIPADWLVPKPPKIVEIQVVDEVWVPAGRGAFGAGIGFGTGSQFVEDPGTYLADSRSYGGMIALASFGVQPISTQGGVFWDGVTWLLVPSIQSGGGTSGFDTTPWFLPSLHAGAAWVLEEFHIGIGGGVIRLRKFEAGLAVPVWYPQPHVTFGVRRGRTDFDLAAGGTPSAGHAQMRGGWLLSDPKPLSFRLGVDASVGAAWFREAPPGDRRASVLTVGVLGRLDAVWGRDR